MLIAIDKGHNCINDTGAVGIECEDTLTRELGDKLIALLNRHGHKTVDVTPSYASSVNNSLRQRVDAANLSDADLFVSLHFNAFNSLAYGSEVYAISQAGRKYGRRILNEIAKLGYGDRGVKTANFYVLKHTKMPAILIECCFLDSTSDMARYDADTMARAICNGILGKTERYSPKLKKHFLKVIKATFLKPSTEQSSTIPSNQLIEIEPGKYPIKSFLPEEEGHYCITNLQGQQHFIFAGHARIES